MGRAVDLCANLKSRITKPQAQKSLSALVEKGELVGKTWGKTIIYCYPQTATDEISSEELKLLQEDVEALKLQEIGLKESLKTLNARELRWSACLRRD